MSWGRSESDSFVFQPQLVENGTDHASLERNLGPMPKSGDLLYNCKSKFLKMLRLWISKQDKRFQVRLVRSTSGVQRNTIRFPGKSGLFRLPEVPGPTAFWDRALPEQSASQLNQREVVDVLLLVPHQDPAALRQPCERPLDHPSPRLVALRSVAALLFLTDPADVRGVSGCGRRPFPRWVVVRLITLAPKKLILTRRASEGSASEPSLARRVNPSSRPRRPPHGP